MRIYLVKFFHLCCCMFFRLFVCSSISGAWGVRNRELMARGEIPRKRSMLNEKSLK